MDQDAQMEQLLQRWQRAAERVLAEGVRVIQVGDEYYASSSSTPLGSYRLFHSPDGWACECPANAEYGMPCKHLAALAEVMPLDLLRDVHIDWEALSSGFTADVGPHQVTQVS